MIEIVNSNEIQWFAPPSGHREAGIEFKHLFTGEEGEPNNYWFTLVQVRERYNTPPHKHMFDQVRFMLKGGFNFGPQEQTEGTIGYFTEGTEYEQSCDSYSYHLLLQCEGGSATRYMSGKSMRAATDELKKIGTFSNGRYTYADGREVDGYEAIYHHLTGEFPTYTTPRYERPIIADPSVFRWTPVDGQDGVSQRNLGTFNERNLKLDFVAIEAGKSCTVEPEEGKKMLGFVTKGSGSAGESLWEEGCGLRFDGNRPSVIMATSDSEIFLIRLPEA